VTAVLIVGVLIVGSMYLYNYATTADRFAVEHVEIAGLTRIDHAEVDRCCDLAGHNILLAPLTARGAAGSASISRVPGAALPDRVVTR
jgi:hypothetical protein